MTESLVEVDGQPVALTTREFELVALLMEALCELARHDRETATALGAETATIFGESVRTEH